MKDLMIFKNEEFGEIRSLEINNEPWFVGNEIAAILGYKNTRDALLKHVDIEDKISDVAIYDGSQNRNMIVINESGLYSLIMSSKLPNAKKFKRWVTSEVLPSIRKNGGYISGQENLSDNELMARALVVAQNTLNNRNKELEEAHKKIEADSGKVLFAECVESSRTSILVGELAKILKQNGIDIGQNRLFKWLRHNKYLISRRGTDFNMPTQISMNMGLFEIKETSVTHSDGHTTISKTPKVTGKGQIYFINKFKELLKNT